MAGHDIVTLGASAGGLEALLAIARDLPGDLPAALFVVLHVSPTVPSMLADILGRASPLRAAAARDREPIEHGRIYCAPPDNHLLIGDGFVRVVRGARENGHRPAVDPLFRTAARTYGPRVVGVVLSGSLDCGTEGLLEVKRRGGVAVVQDPLQARFASMPQSALDNVPVDHCLPVERIPELLVALAAKPPEAPAAPAVAKELVEPEIAFTCPECGGNLVRTEAGPMLSFSCKVGHRYSPQSLATEQSGVLEGALWVALRTIEDSIALTRRLARRARDRNRHTLAAHFEDRRRTAEAQAALVRQALGVGNPPDDLDEGR